MSDCVLFGVLPAAHKAIGVVTLNAERKLNSLTQEMVARLYQQLQQWQNDDNIACVWLQGAGDRAFCAGGDVRALRDKIADVGAQAAQPFVQSFFENEYRLDHTIQTYSKPIIAWGSGIVMGGGIGLMAGASHRIVTDTSRLAMPEISIGLYPDVGGSWFLSRAPGRVGLFVGLTGANLNAADAVFCGLADRCISHADKQGVIDALAASTFTQCSDHNGVLIHQVLRQFDSASDDSKLLSCFNVIQQLTDADTPADMVQSILSFESDDPWFIKAQSTLKAGCPVTAHLVFQQLKRAQKMSLPDVYRMELIMSLQCALHADFAEGVRALLVDKDGAPQWHHGSVTDVSEEYVEAHFKAPWGNGAHPLSDL